jgi:hypothetical protein
MTKVLFNRTAPIVGESIEEPSQELIETSLNLRQVSLEDAARYGGPITRQALGAMNLKGDRKNIVVDTKIHLLMPKFVPAIPGWHTDGVPRGTEMNPAGKGKPNLRAQEEGLVTAPRYHLLVTGTHCPTQFMENPHEFDVNLDLDSDLYAELTRQANALEDKQIFETPASTVVEWDWWNLHTATPSKGRGWRYLIRVAETDYIEPRTNPADFIRTQNQVYVTNEFGW